MKHPVSNHTKALSRKPPHRPDSRVDRRRRSRRRIPSPVERRPWTPKEDRLLGTASDEELAKKLGRSHTTIGNRRRTLGIACVCFANTSAPSPASGLAPCRWILWTDPAPGVPGGTSCRCAALPAWLSQLV